MIAPRIPPPSSARIRFGPGDAKRSASVECGAVGVGSSVIGSWGRKSVRPSGVDETSLILSCSHDDPGHQTAQLVG